jgi:hypothetical protein
MVLRGLLLETGVWQAVKVLFLLVLMVSIIRYGNCSVVIVIDIDNNWLCLLLLKLSQ